MAVNNNYMNIVTYNCKNLRGASEGYVSELLKSTHILALQETWLYPVPYDLNFPSTLGEDVQSFSISSVDIHSEIRCGRPHGGLSFIWKRDYCSEPKIREYNTNRILGLSVAIRDMRILFLNVYFPVNAYDTRDEYNHCVGLLCSILEDREESHVCILGDFNAGPSNNNARARVFTDLEVSLSEYNLSFQDVAKHPNEGIFTHINAGAARSATGGRTWIDHVAMTPEIARCLVDCVPLNEFICSDHCAVKTELNINLI
jgi:exonuclease III